MSGLNFCTYKNAQTHFSSLFYNFLSIPIQTFTLIQYLMYLFPFVSRSGGVELIAQNGKFVVENTLESRLDLMSRQMIPELRVILFGRNPNRKFTD